MSGFLLDTHVLIWWAEDPELISGPARLAISDGRNQLFVSHASLWEINIKISRGKIVLPDTGSELLQRSRCNALPIRLEHVELIRDLPDHHRDPFDRMLIAQSQAERLTVITRDKEFSKYDLAILAA